jgi:N-acetylglucosaminyldiphosphoundecaprenol N-acetyl-beta-D-mannosaminyltransferase
LAGYRGERNLMGQEPTVQPGKVCLLGIPISNKSFLPELELDFLLKRESSLITFVNPLACAIARQDASYPAALNEFDWVLCDGIGMIVAARRLLKIRLNRAAFDQGSLAGPVLRWAKANAKKLVLVGGESSVAEKAGETMRREVPGLDIEKTFTGFQNGLTEAFEFLVRNPGRLVICGMGAPRQEEFLLSLKRAGWSGMGFTCGGFLDQITSGMQYYPAWINHLNLRFLYRLYREPARLWRRYFVEYQVFIRMFVRELVTR